MDKYKASSMLNDAVIHLSKSNSGGDRSAIEIISKLWKEIMDIKSPEIKKRVSSKVSKSLPKLIRVTRLMRRDIEEIRNYREFNYKKMALANQYRELSPERAQDPYVIRWYARKWRKI